MLTCVIYLQDTMNLFLIGYRCTGKTSVGKRLAEKLGWPFLDTDAEVVRESGVSISDVVKEEGWEGFRDKEKGVIRHACTLDRHVVATGGGVVLDELNRERMKKAGVLVWLKAAPATIEERMLKDQHSVDFRPALTSKELIQEIKETLEHRRPYYEKAENLTIETNDVSIDEICNIILKKLKNRFAILCLSRQVRKTLLC